MVVTPSGRETACSELQLEKEEDPILTRVDGRRNVPDAATREHRLWDGRDTLSKHGFTQAPCSRERPRVAPVESCR